MSAFCARAHQQKFTPPTAQRWASELALALKQRSFVMALLVSLVVTFDAASSFADEPRDIEEVYVRQGATRSWSDNFQKATNKPDDSKSVAIVIGISDYSNGWPPLEAPWYDARRVRDYLKGSGFDYVVTLTNKKASLAKIRHYMEDVLPNQVGEHDRFLFYYSGHGSQNNVMGSPLGYLPMVNSGAQEWSTMISMNDIELWSKLVSRSRHSLFILDACFSGLAGVQSKGSELSNYYIDDLLRPGHFLITAGDANQESAASLKQWGGSLFTAALLDGVKGAADSGTTAFPPDGVITLTKLYNYIRERIGIERDKIPQIDQTPLMSDLSEAVKSTGEFFFLTGTGKAHPAFSPPPAKLTDVMPADLSASLSAKERVDSVYSNGLSDFPAYRFGKTLAELGFHYNWSDLPKAGEYTKDDVRYLIVGVNAAGRSLKGYGCISPTSYFVFFFEPKKQSLFRISIRFFDEGVCPHPDIWFTHFANSIGATIQTLDTVRFFQVIGRNVMLQGATGGTQQPQTMVDLIATPYASEMNGLDWLNFVWPR